MHLPMKLTLFITIAVSIITHIECRQDPVVFQTHKKLRTSVQEGNRSQALRYAAQYERQLEAHKIPTKSLVIKLRRPKIDEKRFPHDMEKSHGPGCNCAFVGLISLLMHKILLHRDNSSSILAAHIRQLPAMGQILLLAHILEDAFESNGAEHNNKAFAGHK